VKGRGAKEKCNQALEQLDFYLFCGSGGDFEKGKRKNGFKKGGDRSTVKETGSFYSL